MAVIFVNIGAGGVGNETFENVVVNDSLTVGGAFTSPGIDDNATATQIRLSDSFLSFGDVDYQTCSSNRCFIFGGDPTNPQTIGTNSELSLIGAGYDNTIGDTCSAVTIAGGAHHTVNDNCDHATIGGGSTQTVSGSGSYCTIGGGATNTASANYATIAGGDQNTASGLRSTVSGGYLNTASGEESFVGGGESNQATALNATVSGGKSCTATGQAASVAGGTSVNATGQASHGWGETSTASGYLSEVGGETCTASGVASSAKGQRSKADKRGQRARASGYFAVAGDAQISEMVARNSTTGNQTVNLYLNGSSGSDEITIPDNTTWNFTIQLVARNVDTDAENWCVTYMGGIKKDGSAASAALVGSVSTIHDSTAPTDWSFAITADTTNGALNLAATAGATVTDTIRWVARIDLSEVSG